jgi:3-deoxy-D-manno-octulosonic-acid transferase
VRRLLIVCYEIALWMIALIVIPKMVYNFFVYKKYRKSFLTRLGIKYPIITKTEAPLIWIHAVSVGETKAVVALARELKRQIAGCQLVISSITETGHAESKRSLPFADYHVYLPFDFSPIIHRIIKPIAPDLVILCESDLWYNFLRTVKGLGAAVILVNGKISERSMWRFSQIPFFSKPLLNLFDVLCVQNTLYKERFITAGAAQDKIIITGNLKLDEEYPQLSGEEIKQWRQKLGISLNHLVLTVGSTHDPEEHLFLRILKDVWKKVPNLKVILVPRHPERFKEVAALLEKEGVSTISFTEISRCTGKEQVLLINAMGMLRMCYQLSDVALVGGSYTSKVGGHNILEPCWYEKPVIFGPHMHTQLELVDLIKQYQAGVQVDPDGLKQILEQWLKDPVSRKEFGQRGLRLITDLKGSTKRTVHALSASLLELQKRS